MEIFRCGIYNQYQKETAVRSSLWEICSEWRAHSGLKKPQEGSKMIIPRYYEDLKVLHKNTMPNRSYYIPASGRRDDLVENREASDRFFLLNGTWKFRYYDSIYDLQEEF